MRRNFLTILFSFAASGSFTAGLLGAAQPSSATNAPQAAGAVDPVIAKGKGLEIRRSQLDKEILRAKAQVGSQGKTIAPEQILLLEQQVLEQLINVRLISARATEPDKTAGKAAAEKRYAQAKTKAGSEQAFLTQLKLLGTTREELLAKWTEALTAEEVSKRELKIKVTDKEVRKYYDDNAAKFNVPETVRASHILISTRDPLTKAELTPEQKAAKLKEAEGLLKRARAGEDFAMLVLQYSNDGGSRTRGGEYKFSRGEFVAEVEAVAFAMKPNQISDVVTSPEGYHIVKLFEKNPAGQVPFSKLGPDIEAGLTHDAIQAAFPSYIAELRKKAGVEILDPKLREQAGAGMPGFPGR